MYRIYLYKAALLVYGLIQIAVGILFIVQHERLMIPLSIIGGAVIMLHGFMNIINFITKQGHVSKKRRKSFLFIGIVSIIFGVISLANPNSTFRIATIVFALYIFLKVFFQIKNNDTPITLMQAPTTSLNVTF